MDVKFILSEICSVLESNRGRDKVLRTLCYSFRLVGALTSNQLLAKKLLFLSKHFSNTRTTIRFLDDIPMLKCSLDYGLGKQNEPPGLRYISVLANFLDQIYYPIEKVAWLADHGLISKVDTTKWDTACSVCWIFSTHLSVIRSVIQLRDLNFTFERDSCDTDLDASLEQLRVKKKFLWITLFRQVLDLIHAVGSLPKEVAESFKLPNWGIGFIGSMSSILGLYQIYSKQHI